MKKGILLIAIGNRNYLSMAINLAVSIRSASNIPIALATEAPPPAWLTEKGIININVSVPAEYYTTDGKIEYIKVKTRMYDLSPFQQTIFLDVDTIWLRKTGPEDLFELLDAVDFTISNTGLAEMSIWANIAEVKKAYDTTAPFYNFHSEFVYFKKCDAIKKYFTKVKQVFDRPKVKGMHFDGARIADELAFQIASMLTGIYPHQDNFFPDYWWGRDQKNSESFLFTYQLAEKYHLYSIGGNITPPHIAANYNKLVKFYYQKAGLTGPWLLIGDNQNKKNYIPGRQTI